jgi:glutathione S-transferase
LRRGAYARPGPCHRAAILLLHKHPSVPPYRLAAMSTLTLYHAAPSRSSVALWMLEESGEPYDIKLLRIKSGETRQPSYLAINPMGKVPALKDGDVVITECAAICCYLADTYPKNGLSVPIGDPERGVYLKWLFFGPSCLEPAMIDRSLKREGGARTMLGWGDYDTVFDVVTKAIAKGPYLLGNKFTAADVVIGSGLRWGTMFGLIPKSAEIAAYVSRLEQRPALKRATEKDTQFAAA